MKVWNYMVIMLGMMIFLFFLGFPLTGSSETLEDIGIHINSTETGESYVDISSSNWFEKLFDKFDGIIAVLALGGAVIVGLFGKTLDWKIVLGVPFFSLFLIKFVRVAWAVVEMTDETWLKAVFITIFGTLGGGFVISLVEWFGGSPSD
jgi:hypothetical protein